jgi:hypothetical protein
MLFLEVVGGERGGGGSYCYLLLLSVAICGGVVGRVFVVIREELGDNLCY